MSCVSNIKPFFFLILLIVLFNNLLCSYARLPEYEPNRLSPIQTEPLRRRSSSSGFLISSDLIKSLECNDDIQRLCHNLIRPDDLDLLECLQTPKGDQPPSPDCQNAVWTRATAIINDAEKSGLGGVCSEEINTLECHRGNILACLLERKETLSEGKCLELLRRLEPLALLDLRLVPRFAESCKLDIDNFKCGRLIQSKSLSEGRVLSCLQKKIQELTKDCRRTVLLLAELQGEGIRLDRPLFTACAGDLLQLCNGFSGAPYQCLEDRKQHRRMSQTCREELARREKLIAADYKVSRSLARACREDIRAQHCRAAGNGGGGQDARLARLLLCLETATRNGTKLKLECTTELIAHRRMLMTDYQLTPEVAADCGSEIAEHCPQLGTATLHCLMSRASARRRRDRLTPKCLRALDILLHQTDAAEDWTVDPVVRDACSGPARRWCSNETPGGGRVIHCLLERLDESDMPTTCKQSLLQIQYFVARDFRLDPALYTACREDASRCGLNVISGPGNGLEDPTMTLILPCLYRLLISPQPEVTLQTKCAEQVTRAMRERATRVSLQPEIESACLDDLASQCSDRTGPGEEMACLQDHLDDRLSSQCRAIVTNFTELEARRVADLNPAVAAYCGTLARNFCPDAGDALLDCLIEHKSEQLAKPLIKCRAALEHMQLISLKDYRFTFRFKEACKSAASRYCPRPATKTAVVHCLSEIVRDDTLKDQKARVTRQCRKELRAQLLQQRERLELDPVLEEACALDASQFCSSNEGSPKDSNKITNTQDCLEQNEKSLTAKCRAEIFKRKQQQLGDPEIDLTLVTACKQQIREYCPNITPENTLDCLKGHKEDQGFDNKCRIIVTRRQIERTADYRFNPRLERSCKQDISKFCGAALSRQSPDRELDGLVIKCLRNQLRERRLTDSCHDEMAAMLRDAQMDYRLDAQLWSSCGQEISTLCPDSKPSDIEECLRRRLIAHRIESQTCRLQVATLIAEAETDIHADPLLENACISDLLKHCSGVKRGDGRRFHCLRLAQDSLTSECKRLLEARLLMYQSAEGLLHPAQPETVSDLLKQVRNSPSSAYFLVVALSFLGAIFIAGLFCGRATRRVVQKNK